MIEKVRCRGRVRSGGLLLGGARGKDQGSDGVKFDFEVLRGV